MVLLPYRILIADDALMNRTLIRNILEEHLEDVVFEEAENGLQVLIHVEKHAIDLIILDLVMPELDGYETLKRLKSDVRYSDIPVIVNSAITEIHSIENILKEGAVDYFTKPLSLDDMKIKLPLKARNALTMHAQRQTIMVLNDQINEELKNANIFANIMLPKPEDMKLVDLYIKYHPSMGIGGDFFDCVERDGRIHFMIADVTGHGIAAGMASSMVKVLYRKCIEKSDVLPHEILEEMNRSIFEWFDFAGVNNYFVFTAFVGVIENGMLYYSNAGQPYPILFNFEDHETVQLEQNGFLIGMMEDVAYDTVYRHIYPGDALLLYTDGLFCSGEAHDFVGWESVFQLATQLREEMIDNANGFLEELFYGFHMIHKARHSTFTDDVAMMLIKLRP